MYSSTVQPASWRGRAARPVSGRKISGARYARGISGAWVNRAGISGCGCEQIGRNLYYLTELYGCSSPNLYRAVEASTARSSPTSRPSGDSSIHTSAPRKQFPAWEWSSKGLRGSISRAAEQLGSTQHALWQIIIPMLPGLFIQMEADASMPFTCLLYTSPSPRDLSTSRMPSSA